MLLSAGGHRAQAFRPSPSSGWRLLDICWVLVPVSVGAGVPGALRVLRGQALVFALRVGGGLPPGILRLGVHDGVLAPCPVGLPVLVRWQSWRRLALSEHSAKDLGVIAFGGGGGGVGGGL